MSNPFFQSKHCQSGIHCETCRSTNKEGVEFRNSISKLYELPVDYDCEYNKPWDYQSITIGGKEIDSPLAIRAEIFTDDLDIDVDISTEDGVDIVTSDIVGSDIRVRNVESTLNG